MGFGRPKEEKMHGRVEGDRHQGPTARGSQQEKKKKRKGPQRNGLLAVAGTQAPSNSNRGVGPKLNNESNYTKMGRMQ